MEKIHDSALQVCMIVSEKTGVPVYAILGKCRKKEYVSARHLSVYLIHKIDITFKTNRKERASLKRIGAWFDRDHSCIINSIRKVRGWMDSYDDYKSYVESYWDLVKHIRFGEQAPLSLFDRIVRLPEHEKKTILNYISKLEEKYKLPVNKKAIMDEF